MLHTGVWLANRRQNANHTPAWGVWISQLCKQLLQNNFVPNNYMAGIDWLIQCISDIKKTYKKYNQNEKHEKSMNKNDVQIIS